MTAAPGWIKWWFRVGAVYGIAVLTPLYARAMPAQNPEFYYGFIGTALAFQLIYWTIGSDPIRYRGLMPIAVIAKLGFFVPCLLLYLSGKLAGVTMGFASVDLVLAAGFLLAWRTTPTA